MYMAATHSVAGSSRDWTSGSACSIEVLIAVVSGRKQAGTETAAPCEAPRCCSRRFEISAVSRPAIGLLHACKIAASGVLHANVFIESRSPPRGIYIYARANAGDFRLDFRLS